MRVKIRGKDWLVREATFAKSHLGECTWDDRIIEVAPGQAPRQLFDTLIHETLHAADDKMTEKKVREMTRALITVL